VKRRQGGSRPESKDEEEISPEIERYWSSRPFLSMGKAEIIYPIEARIYIAPGVRTYGMLSRDFM